MSPPRRQPAPRLAAAAAAAAAAALVALAASGCDRGGGGDASELHVHAAASLQELVRELEALYEAEHEGVDVVVHLAGSQQLRTWIEHGAPADVFVSASTSHVEQLARAGRVREVELGLVCNQPVLAVPADNPAGLAAFADLPRAERIVLGVPTVPIGAYADAVLERASAPGALGPDFARQVHAALVSRELDTRQVLARVRLGEADAAIVYRTDALAAGDAVRVLEIPARYAVEARYPVATLRPGTAPAGLARAWVELMASPRGRALLAARGFVPCSATP